MRKCIYKYNSWKWKMKWWKILMKIENVMAKRIVFVLYFIQTAMSWCLASKQFYFSKNIAMNCVLFKKVDSVWTIYRNAHLKWFEFEPLLCQIRIFKNMLFNETKRLILITYDKIVQIEIYVTGFFFIFFKIENDFFSFFFSTVAFFIPGRIIFR